MSSYSLHERSPYEPSPVDPGSAGAGSSPLRPQAHAGVPGSAGRHPELRSRRLRLSAELTSPAAAREVVRSLVQAAELTELLDNALLLTSEVVTNAVLHTATDLELDVSVDRFGLSVTVTDHAPTFLGRAQTGRADPPAAPPAGGLDDLALSEQALSEVAEGGYGLALVDSLSSGWGVTHHGKSKSVWFVLDAEAAGFSTGGSAMPPYGGLAEIRALLRVDATPDDAGSAQPFAQELLLTLAQSLEAPAGVVRVDRADGAGSAAIATYGRELRAEDPRVWRTALPVSRPWSGELLIEAPASATAQALLQLAAERLGMTLEVERLREADLRRQTWLTFLAEVSELLAQSLDVALTMALIPRLVVPRLGTWCAVFIPTSERELRRASMAHADESALPWLQSSLARALGAPGEGVLDAALRSGGYTPVAAPIEGFTVPLIARGQWLGSLLVGRSVGAEHRRDPDEITIVEEVAHRAAVAIDNARIHEERRQVMQALQQSLLPPTLPEIVGLGLGAEYVPAGTGLEVGGDFYDVLAMPDGRWLVLVGDVSGKGVHAAAVTGLMRDVIRVLVRDGRPIDSVLSTLNDTLLERRGRYCTLAVAVIADPVGGGHDRQVTLHLAGHDRPLLIRADGQVDQVGVGGTALGLLDTVTSPATTLTLRPGDAMAFFTDGVTDRRHGPAFYGAGRLTEAARQLSGYPAAIIAAGLRASTLDFSTEAPRDDIAIVVLRNEGAS